MSKAAELAALIGSQTALSNKNLIINGAMQVAQRSTSVSALTGSGYKTVDRWNTAASGATYSQSQETVTLGDSAIGDFKNYLKHNATTGNADHGITYRVEDVQSVLEGTVTLSFYAKGTNPNGGHMEMIATQNFGTGGSPSSDVAQIAQDFTLTASWQRFEFQITVPSLSGKTVGTDGNSYYQIKLAQPSDDSSTDAWELNITGVQLEVGSTATPFEHRSYGDELLRCQRYYCRSYNIGTDTGTNTLDGAITTRQGGTPSTNNVAFNVDFPVTMRSAPTMTLYAKDGTSGQVSDFGNSYSGDGTDRAVNAVNAIGMRGFGGGNFSGVSENDIVIFHYEASSEL